jgi:hypothetical protein
VAHKRSNYHLWRRSHPNASFASPVLPMLTQRSSFGTCCLIRTVLPTAMYARTLSAGAVSQHSKSGRLVDQEHEFQASTTQENPLLPHLVPPCMLSQPASPNLVECDRCSLQFRPLRTPLFSVPPVRRQKPRHGDVRMWPL